MKIASPVETLVTDHLDLWTAALKRKSTAGRGSSSKVELYGIKKLRELILELAVRGLLVPQDPNDEPASELLKKIAGEKARLGVKKRRLEELGDDAFSSRTEKLPRGWQWAKAASLFPTKSGNSKLIKGKLYDNPSEDLFPGYSASGQDVWLDRWEHEGTAIILSAVGARCGKAFMAKGKWSAIANTHIVWVVPTITLPEFAMLHLNNESYWIRSGGAQPFVKVGETLARDFPLPPLAEQHRIVAKVDALMALCDRLEQQTDASLGAHQTLSETLLSALTSAADHAQFASAWQRIAGHFDTLFTTEESIAQLKQTILQLAVMGKLVPQDPNDEPARTLLKRIQTEKARLIAGGKIKKDKPLPPIADDEKSFELPQSWAWVKPEEFSIKITDGEHFRPPVEESGVYFLSAKDVREGGVSFDDPLFISEETARKALQRCNPEYGDLLIVSRGATVGRMCKVNTHEKFCLLGSVILVKPTTLVLSDYLSISLKSPSSFSKLINASGSTAQPAIYLKDLKRIAFPLPPIEEQHRIVAKVEELMALCDQLKSRLSDAQTTQLHLADALVELAIC